MAELGQLELDVRGMTCDSCALHRTQALRQVMVVSGSVHRRAGQ